jgi:hypothetical protein
VAAGTDLKEEALLLSRRDPRHEIHDPVVAKLASPADRPTMVRHDIGRESIKRLVGAGFGIGLTIEASLGANFAGVVHREVRDGTVQTRGLAIQRIGGRTTKIQHWRVS